VRNRPSSRTPSNPRPARLVGYRRYHPGTQPEYNFPPYASTQKRCPTQPLVLPPQTISEITGPVFGTDDVKPTDNDLTRQHKGAPIGERIVVSGRVLDENGKPVRHTLIEIWQANAGGRYRHVGDNWPAPLDPNFTGLGRALTDSEGRYEFTTVKPGAYPWGNHDNAWRPAHIHFSLFGTAFTQRLVTQMYFPDDPLFFQDPIFNAIPEAARPLAISRFDYERTVPNWALAFEWDIVLRGREQTPFETEDDGDVA
jgi:protocatechuate 3,4-dioxygenase, beta subunit